MQFFSILRFKSHCFVYLFYRIASSHLCPVMAWGSYDEWHFALDRLSNFPSNRSKAERTFLLKTVAGCPREAKKYETYVSN